MLNLCGCRCMQTYRSLFYVNVCYDWVCVCARITLWEKMYGLCVGLCCLRVLLSSNYRAECTIVSVDINFINVKHFCLCNCRLQIERVCVCCMSVCTVNLAVWMVFVVCMCRLPVCLFVSLTYIFKYLSTIESHPLMFPPIRSLPLMASLDFLAAGPLGSLCLLQYSLQYCFYAFFFIA